MRTLCLALLAATLAPFAVKPAAAQAVDLELVLAVDASGSIDEDELLLQRKGYADAFVHPRVLGAIRSGYHRRIAVMFLEWAATGCERVVVDWMPISDAASARGFADAVMAGPRGHCPGGNAIGDAINFSVASMAANSFQGERLVIDVSGDGPNSVGSRVERARDAAVAQGVVINGLALIRPGRTWGGGYGLTEHYKTAIIGGPGAFVIEAEKGEAFFDAVLNKLVREISALETRGPVPN
ncbi:MAG: DUF1194 domain-containing protein [Alphaproteobacteria bacterium]